MSTTITFTTGDNQSEHGTIWIEQGTALANIKTFAQKLQPYTTAQIQAVSATQKEYLELDGSGSGDIQSVQMAAHLFIRSRASGTVYGFKLLAPSAAILDEFQEVDQDFGDNFAEWYSDLAGELFDFEHGALTGSTA